MLGIISALLPNTTFRLSHTGIGQTDVLHLFHSTSKYAEYYGFILHSKDSSKLQSAQFELLWSMPKAIKWKRASLFVFTVMHLICITLLTFFS
jgi:hypothetical protein